MAFWDWSTADSEKDCTPPEPDASTFFLSDPWYVVFWAACWYLFNQSDLLKSAVDFRTYNIRYLPILTCATSYRLSVRLFTQLACQPTITWQAKYSNLKGLVNSSITVKQKSPPVGPGLYDPCPLWATKNWANPIRQAAVGPGRILRFATIGSKSHCQLWAPYVTDHQDSPRSGPFASAW